MPSRRYGGAGAGTGALTATVKGGLGSTTYVPGTPAGLTLNPNGTYSFDPSDTVYQHLALGATQVVVASYTVTDQHGASSSSTLTITVTGTNDAPIAVADVGSATEDGSVLTGSVATNDTDIDDGAVLSEVKGP